MAEINITFGGREYAVGFGANSVAENAAQRAAAAQAAAAALAASAGATVATAVMGSPRQGNSGAQLGADGGPMLMEIASGKSRALAIFSVAADGTKGTTYFTVNTLTGQMLLEPVAVRDLAALDRVHVRSVKTASERSQVFDGQVIFAPPSATRFAWGIPGFWYDSVDGVLRMSLARAADETSVANSIVSRGGVLGFARPTRAKQIGQAAGIAPMIVQGTAMRPKNLRTHQQCPTMTRSGRYMYASFSAASRVLGGDYSQAEGPDSYVSIMRRPVGGGTWQEVAQVVASASYGRIADPMLQIVDGRVGIFFPFLAMGKTTESYKQGIYVSWLENPDAPDGSKLVFTTPAFLTYGLAATGLPVNGEFWLPVYIPWTGYTTGSGYWSADYTSWGSRYATPGARLARLVTKGTPNVPFIEALTVLPKESDPAQETYTEPQIVQLSRALGASADWWAITRSLQGVRETYGTNQDDGTISWTALANATAKFNGNSAPVRRRVIRTAMGNILTVGNTQASPNRRAMGIMISQDETATFGSLLVVESASGTSPNWPTSYPDAVSWIDVTSGRSKVAIVYDEGRGTGAGLPANIWYHEFYEDEIIAGTVTTSASVAARELVSALAYAP
jgi:hypothetical protein